MDHAGFYHVWFSGLKKKEKKKKAWISWLNIDVIMIFMDATLPAASWGISNIRAALGYVHPTLCCSHTVSQYKIDVLCLGPQGELWARDVFLPTTAPDRWWQAIFKNASWVMVRPKLQQRASLRSSQQGLHITSCQQGAHRWRELCTCGRRHLLVLSI